MKKATIIVSILILFAYTGCRAQSNNGVEEAAVSAVKVWLEQVDGEHYGESWDEAAEFFRGAVTRDNWIQAMQTIRKPLGKNLSRELISSTYRTSLPGAPEGEYVVVQFKSSFENNDSVIETITPALGKDGKWHTSGYFIK